MSRREGLFMVGLCRYAEPEAGGKTGIAMPSRAEAILKRWLSQRHFFAGVAIPCFAVFILLLGGLKNISIILHEARTTATISEISSSGRGRSSLRYRYEINGHTYTGSGAPDHPPNTPPYSVGNTFEVRYSTAHPSFSTAQNPWTLFGQFGVGSLFLLWADYMAIHYGKRREAKV
jgi:hypothetical protein